MTLRRQARRSGRRQAARCRGRRVFSVFRPSFRALSADHGAGRPRPSMLARHIRRKRLAHLEIADPDGTGRSGHRRGPIAIGQVDALASKSPGIQRPFDRPFRNKLALPAPALRYAPASTPRKANQGDLRPCPKAARAICRPRRSRREHLYVFRVWLRPRSGRAAGYQRMRRQAFHHGGHRASRQARSGQIERSGGCKIKRRRTTGLVVLGRSRPRLGRTIPRPRRCRATDIENATIDCAVSVETLEHIPADDISIYSRKFAASCGPTASPSCEIDYGDHFKGFDPSISAFNFLTYSDEDWQPFQSRFQYVNRLRHSEYVVSSPEPASRLLFRVRIADPSSRRSWRGSRRVFSGFLKKTCSPSGR